MCCDVLCCAVLCCGLGEGSNVNVNMMEGHTNPVFILY
jgi:hypothetical protein